MNENETREKINDAIEELSFEDMLENHPVMLGVMIHADKSRKMIKNIYGFIAVQVLFDIVFALIIMGVI